MASTGTRQRVGTTVAGLGLLLLGRRGRDCSSRSGGVVGTVAVASLVVAAAGSALAADATGTLSGKSTCWQKGRAREQRGSTMLISQRGEALFVEIDGTAYRGESHDSNRGGTRARGSAARCTEGGEGFHDPSEVLTLKVNVDEVRGTTRITAESTGSWAAAAGGAASTSFRA
jgi:hypothetical protein